jgi:hypothetical protein
MINKFKVNDRVIVNGDSGTKIFNEKNGTVLEVSGSYCLIEFDENIGGHDGILKPFGKPHHCWYVHHSIIRPYKNEVIVIYRDGNKVVAKDKSTGEKAVARCHPDDKFDFKYGAVVAFNRLHGVELEQEEPKYYSGRIICINDGTLTDVLTVGKIYEVVNGRCVVNKGKILTSSPIVSLADLNARFSTIRFIEVKE